MVLPITIIGNPVLRKEAKEITKDYEGLSALISNMFETTYKAEGVGLAAPQVGKSIRLFVIDASPFEEDEPELKDFKKIFINAQIIERSGKEWAFNEGCLSLPSVREDVKRPEKIRITYYDENFEFHDEYYDGMAARIIQHEYDHLEGVLFVDRLKPLKRRILKGKLNSVSKGKFEVGYRCKLV